MLRRAPARLLSLCAALVVASAGAADDSAMSDQPSGTESAIERAHYQAEKLGVLSSARLREASGLALSTRTPDIVWSHNDSGYGAYVFAFTVQGEPRGQYLLDKAGSSDWEDMAAFRWQEQSWLLVADTGDNKSKKPFYTLYLAKEPELIADRSVRVKPLRDIRAARIRYPTGPADTEAVAVDPTEQRVYLLTKRKRPVEVFSVPLSVFDSTDKVHEARFETYLFDLPSPTLQELLDYPKLGLALAQPNALDLAPDRSFAIVHTYGCSYRFDRTSTQSWADAFKAAPRRIEVPRMQQGEAVAIGANSHFLYYTSEGRRPPLYRLQPVENSNPD